MRRGVEAAPDLEYVGGVEIGDDLGAFLSSARPQAVIDFTHPASALSNALAYARAGIAPVIGTTGFTPEAVDQVEAACREAGVGGIIAPNFAVGAVLMMHLADIAAPFFDAAEVIEMHQDTKADAPSGTALATARRLGGRKKFSYKHPEKVTLESARGGEEAGVGIHSSACRAWSRTRRSSSGSPARHFRSPTEPRRGRRSCRVCWSPCARS